MIEEQMTKINEITNQKRDLLKETLNEILSEITNNKAEIEKKLLYG